MASKIEETEEELRAKLMKIMEENKDDEIDEDEDEEYFDEFKKSKYDLMCEKCLGDYSSKSKYACKDGDGLTFCCEDCMLAYDEDW